MRNRNKNLSTVFLILVSVVLCFLFAFLFYRQFSKSPSIQTYCLDSLGHEIEYVVGDPVTERYSDCIRRNAKLFIEKDYEVTKDLAKSFLTLLAGLLVGSITFSEKIINLHSASSTARNLMISCWFFFLAAIIACGVGLALMTIAAGWAAYQPFRDFRTFEYPAVVLFVAAGLAFGAGLASLLIAGIVSMRERKDAAG